MTIIIIIIIFFLGLLSKKRHLIKDAMENIIDLIYELKKKCKISDAQFITEQNISDSEYHFFLIVANSDDLNSKSLAEKMNLSPSRVSRVVDKLVKNGYLLRKSSETDRRNIDISLTKKGQELSENIKIFRKDCEKKIIERLSKEELLKAKGLFKNLIETL